MAEGRALLKFNVRSGVEGWFEIHFSEPVFPAEWINTSFNNPGAEMKPTGKHERLVRKLLRMLSEHWCGDNGVIISSAAVAIVAFNHCDWVNESSLTTLVRLAVQQTGYTPCRDVDLDGRKVEGPIPRPRRSAAAYGLSGRSSSRTFAIAY